MDPYYMYHRRVSAYCERKMINLARHSVQIWTQIPGTPLTTTEWNQISTHAGCRYDVYWGYFVSRMVTHSSSPVTIR